MDDGESDVDVVVNIAAKFFHGVFDEIKLLIFVDENHFQMCIRDSEKSSFREGGNLARDGFMKVEMQKDGKMISVYNVHFSYQSDYERQRQIQLAADVFAADPNRYKILMGDFNIKNFDELAPFADFNMLSTEEKPLKTYHGRDWDTKCLDNIIYTDTLVLKKSKMVYSELSDHDALTAEFEMR